MATDTRTAAPTQATDANFRLWVIAVDAALLAAGLTAASDTGQINTATVTRPTVAFSIRGFKMYRFNDALQATKPVFIKVEFSSGGAATNPYLIFTVGTGSDGAGTITGLTTVGPLATLDGMTASTTARIMYAAGVASEGWFTFVLWPGLHDGISAGSHSVLMVDRTRDAAGATTGDGLFVYLSPNSSGVPVYYMDFTFPVAPAAYRYAITAIWKTESMVLGTDVYLVPIFPGAGAGRFWPPTLAGLLYNNGEITRNTSISVTMYGAAHTFKCLGNWQGSLAAPTGIAQPVDPNACLAIRWE